MQWPWILKVCSNCWKGTLPAYSLFKTLFIGRYAFLQYTLLHVPTCTYEKERIWNKSQGDTIPSPNWWPMYVILLIFNSLVYNIPAFTHSTYQTYKCNKGWITFCRCISRLFATCGNFFPYMLQNGTRNLRNQHTYMYCVRWFIHLVIFSEPFRTSCMVWGFPLCWRSCGNF
jgi:hypothetical protein